MSARSDAGEEVVAVVYHEYEDGKWLPHSIQTRIRTPRGWYALHYDAAYSKTDDIVFVSHCGSGGDGNEVDVGPYVDPLLMPARIWLHEDARLSTYGDSERVPVERTELAAMGYALVDTLPSDPFEDTTEGETTWCDACQDFIDDEDTFECAICSERGHSHGVGQIFIAFDEQETSIPSGLYKVTECPFFVSSMLGGGYIYEDAVERVGSVPDRADDCGRQLLATSQRTALASER